MCRFSVETIPTQHRAFRSGRERLSFEPIVRHESGELTRRARPLMPGTLGHMRHTDNDELLSPVRQRSVLEDRLAEFVKIMIKFRFQRAQILKVFLSVV